MAALLSQNSRAGNLGNESLLPKMPEFSRLIHRLQPSSSQPQQISVFFKWFLYSRRQAKLFKGETLLIYNSENSQ
jgi:hypothetical protein